MRVSARAYVLEVTIPTDRRATPWRAEGRTDTLVVTW
jgi:hypothetical protein